MDATVTIPQSTNVYNSKSIVQIIRSHYLDNLDCVHENQEIKDFKFFKIVTSKNTKRKPRWLFWDQIIIENISMMIICNYNTAMKRALNYLTFRGVDSGERVLVYSNSYRDVFPFESDDGWHRLEVWIDGKLSGLCNAHQCLVGEHTGCRNKRHR